MAKEDGFVLSEFDFLILPVRKKNLYGLWISDLGATCHSKKMDNGLINLKRADDNDIISIENGKNSETTKW